MKAAKIAGAFIGGISGGAADPGAILSAADAARDRTDWVTAAHHYRRYLKRKPDHAEIWVQLGNMCKEARQIEASMAAYRKALALGLNTSDTHLQLGHLHKIMGDRQGAIQFYLDALDFTPLNLHAYGELELMGLVDQANEKIVRTHSSSHRAEQMIVFDVSDLVFYIGEHDNLSGIQRVQCCVIQAVMKYALHDLRDLRLISYDRELRAFRSIDQEKFLALIDDLALPKARRSVDFDVVAARHGRLFPQEPLAAFVRPGRTIVVLLGAAWVIPEYASLIVNLKRSHNARFAMLFHDFIPIYARETCDQGTAVVFREFVDQVLPIVDSAMCVSRSTERDLKRYCEESGFPVPPTLVTQLGTSFDEFFPRGTDTLQPHTKAQGADPFVLFVSTIEGRKNHNFMFKTWQALAERGIDVPRLVCVGRFGWRAQGFLTNLFETDFLGGRIELREDVSDEALNALYRDCLFTVFPSVYEGWGLPIGESLGHGKLCVLADNSSLPEVAGEFGCFIPIDDVDAAADIIAGLLENPDRLRAYEEAIAERFIPLRWEDVAGRVVKGCNAVQRSETPSKARPLVVPGSEYTLKKVRGGFDDLVGRALIESIEESYNAPIFGGNTRAAHRIAGLLARDDKWRPAEHWGSWALHERAGLQFALDPACLADEREVVFYGAFAFSASVMGSRVRLLVGGTRLGDERSVESQSSVLAWALSVTELRRHATESADGLLAVDLQFELMGVTPAMREEGHAIDPHAPTFGLKSFVLLGASAMAERLRIAERNAYRLAC